MSKMTDFYRRKRESGLCLHCPKMAMENAQVCLDCWAKKIAVSAGLKRQSGKDLLEKLRAQNFKCFYTEKNLVPGDNASIDHVVPRTRGGSDSVGNLVWVDKQVNRIKNNLTHEEFISFCKEISKRFQ